MDVFVGSNNLSDNNPNADEDRAKHGMEPLEGHHYSYLRFWKLLSASVVPELSKARPGSWPRSLLKNRPCFRFRSGLELTHDSNRGNLLFDRGENHSEGLSIWLYYSPGKSCRP